jgi:hypothetical protein
MSCVVYDFLTLILLRLSFYDLAETFKNKLIRFNLKLLQ